MEKQPIRDHGGLFKVVCSPLILEATESLFLLDWHIFLWEMAEKLGRITHILERESKKHQEAMKVQVGTTFSQINNPNKGESFIHLLVLVLSPSG